MFETFHARYGQGARVKDLTSEAHARLAATLPVELLDLFRADGFAAYLDQLFWTLDHQDFAPALAAWLPSIPQLTLFARSAFGDLYLWDGAYVQVIHPHIGQVGPLTSNVGRFFDQHLVRDSYIQKALLEPLVRRAARKVGPLEPDEMYGYEPALALGGSGKIDTVRRLKINEHHLLLSQLLKLSPIVG